MSDEKHRTLIMHGEEWEVISTYGDEQMLEDGNSVAVTQQDRVIRTVWDWMVERLPEGNAPPDRWPVEMMGWFQAKTRDDKALAASKALIDDWRVQATRVWEENIDGGVFKLYAESKGESISRLKETGTDDDVVLWLIPNEVGGITLMFPSDY